MNKKVLIPLLAISTVFLAGATVLMALFLPRKVSTYLGINKSEILRYEITYGTIEKTETTDNNEELLNAILNTSITPYYGDPCKCTSLNEVCIYTNSHTYVIKDYLGKIDDQIKRYNFADLGKVMKPYFD